MSITNAGSQSTTGRMAFRLALKGLAAFPLAAGLAVSLDGEVRPSELKVMRMAIDGREPVSIETKKLHHVMGHKHADAPVEALRGTCLQ